jgi:hypothetical protein
MASMAVWPADLTLQKLLGTGVTPSVVPVAVARSTDFPPTLSDVAAPDDIATAVKHCFVPDVALVTMGHPVIVAPSKSPWTSTAAPPIVSRL